ncbi:putative protein kinase pkk2 [Diaporthe ampelina]|uniref:Uncharacterized protein n=1 Tax=Diaporthe ampelina TaxID=1214573 RepID=A0A0G2FL74_9PEZI|nr:putative protein kinase pkk2 [Diaporthe ampelina]
MADNRGHLARLPAELFLLIAEDPCLSTRDLVAFALANSRHATLALPVLYKKNIREENASALLWAVLKENTKIMALLIQYGADINSVEASTGLHQCLPYRWIKSLRTNFEFTPLALAARKGLPKAAKWLLENGADPEVPARDLCPCDNEPKTSSGMWRVSRQAGGQPMNQPHWTALHLAVHYGHEDIVQLLVAHGANTRQVCRLEDGPCSVLHTAFIHEREPTINSLMYRFEGTDMVDINARGRGGITPLHIAYCLQSPSLVDMALKFGAYVNLEYQIDRNEWTLFSMACTDEDWSFALRLLKLGAAADFDLEDEYGRRWTINHFLRDVESRLHSFPFGCAASPLLDELDRLTRDHEVAWL